MYRSVMEEQDKLDYMSVCPRKCAVVCTEGGRKKNLWDSGKQSEREHRQ